MELLLDVLLPHEPLRSERVERLVDGRPLQSGLRGQDRCLDLPELEEERIKERFLVAQAEVVEECFVDFHRVSELICHCDLTKRARIELTLNYSDTFVTSQ